MAGIVLTLIAMFVIALSIGVRIDGSRVRRLKREGRLCPFCKGKFRYGSACSYCDGFGDYKFADTRNSDEARNRLGTNRNRRAVKPALTPEQRLRRQETAGGLFVAVSAATAAYAAGIRGRYWYAVCVVLVIIFVVVRSFLARHPRLTNVIATLIGIGVLISASFFLIRAFRSAATR